MKKEIIRIENLHQPGCSNTIKQHLLHIKGVKEVSFNFDNNTVVIGTDDQYNLLNTILETLNKIGHPQLLNQ